MSQTPQSMTAISACHRVVFGLHLTVCIKILVKTDNTNLQVRHNQQVWNLFSVVNQAVPVKHVNGSVTAEERIRD